MSDTFKPLTKNRPSMTNPQSGALPPAGHARNEELKKRADVLQAQGEQQFQNVEAVNPDALEVENELAGHFNMLDVTDKEPGYVYKWVNFVNNGGIALREATAPPERWQVVSGDMKEARELKDASGTRKLGDVMLVRMPAARYAMIEKVRADKAARQQGAAAMANNLQAIAGKSGIRVHTVENAPENVQRAMTHPSPAAVAQMRGSIEAQRAYEQSLRTGAIDVTAQ